MGHHLAGILGIYDKYMECMMYDKYKYGISQVSSGNDYQFAIERGHGHGVCFPFKVVIFNKHVTVYYGNSWTFFDVFSFGSLCRSLSLKRDTF